MNTKEQKIKHLESNFRVTLKQVGNSVNAELMTEIGNVEANGIEVNIKDFDLAKFIYQAILILQEKLDKLYPSEKEEKKEKDKKTRVYRGWIYNDEFFITSLGDRTNENGVRLAEKIYEEWDAGDVVSVRYYVTNKEVTLDEAVESLIKKVHGYSDLKTE